MRYGLLIQQMGTGITNTTNRRLAAFAKPQTQSTERHYENPIGCIWHDPTNHYRNRLWLGRGT